jgi:DNA (cytosine-5)-methyltransferase 1
MQLLRCVDLFAGAVGLSLGFQEAGFHVAHVVEEDKWAAETFARNFPSAASASKPW